MKPSLSFSSLLQSLQTEFQTPLPGLIAQEQMAPESRRNANVVRAAQGRKHRRGSVLILLYPKHGQSHFVLIQRSPYDGVHGGQIALPGGGHEAEESDWQTAQRETFEEVGVPQSDITCLGQLTSLYIPPSNFMVYPFVGYTCATPHFIPDPHEVAAIIETPLAELLNPAHQQEKWMEHPRLGRMLIPYYDIFEHHVWGATAMILAEFAVLVNRATG